jgi:predicted nuclease of predicted toxin-antitoxin system
MLAKLDENLPVECADRLRAAGWECDTVLEESLGGAEDPEVGTRCRTERRVLFTLDLDFADIRAYPPDEYVGIVVLRPARPSRRNVLALLESAIARLVSEWADHRLWIVEPGRIRIRGGRASDVR